MIDFENLQTPPPGTHWEKRDFVVSGETWCVVRNGLHGAIVARVPMSDLEREATKACLEVQNG